jgi:peptide/nickel transport system substrate-binding protein
MVVNPRRLRRPFVVLAAFLLLAACSSESAEPSDTGETGTDTTEAGGADPNGVIRVGYDHIQQVGFIVLDPVASDRVGANEGLYSLVYGTFLRETDDGSLEPELAESATVTDPSTIELVIRDGVTFHDGTPFDAAAVKAGLDRTLAEGNPTVLTAAFLALQSVDVVAPDTVRLNIPDGSAARWYDTFLSGWETTIVKPAGPFEVPIGAGPMRVVAHQPGQSLTLETYDDYWDADAMRVARMELVSVDTSQPQSGTAALRSGQIDFAPTDITQMDAFSGNIEVHLQPSDGSRTVQMVMCKSQGPLADVDARLAVSKAIDREAINEAVFKGTAVPATQIWPDGHRFNDPDIADDLAYDVDGARAALAASDHPDGFSFDIRPLPVSGLPEVAAIMQQQLKVIGVEMNIVAGSNYVADFLQANVAGAGLQAGGQQGRAKLNAWSGDSLGNVCDYDDPELNQLIAELAPLSDSTDEAVDLWHEISALAVDDVLNVPLLFQSGITAYNTDRLDNLVLIPGFGFALPDPRETFVKG